MSVATADSTSTGMGPGQTLTKLLVEYRDKLNSIREAGLTARRRLESASGWHDSTVTDPIDDVREAFKTAEPAATKLIRHASQWLDHSAPHGSAEEFELSVRLAEFEPLLKQTSEVVSSLDFEDKAADLF